MDKKGTLIVAAVVLILYFAVAIRIQTGGREETDVQPCPALASQSEPAPSAATALPEEETATALSGEETATAAKEAAAEVQIEVVQEAPRESAPAAEEEQVVTQPALGNSAEEQADRSGAIAINIGERAASPADTLAARDRELAEAQRVIAVRNQQLMRMHERIAELEQEVQALKTTKDELLDIMSHRGLDQREAAHRMPPRRGCRCGMGAAPPAPEQEQVPAAAVPSDEKRTVPANRLKLIDPFSAEQNIQQSPEGSR